MTTQEFVEFQKSLSPSQTFVIINEDDEVVSQFSEGCEVYQKSKIDYIDGFNIDSSLKLNLLNKSVAESKQNGKSYPIDKDSFNFSVVDFADLGYVSLFRAEDHRNEKPDAVFFENKSAILLSIIVIDKDGKNYHPDFLNDLGEPKLQSILFTSLGASAFAKAYFDVVKDANGLNINVKQRAVFELTHILQNYKNQKSNIERKNVPTGKFVVKKFLNLSYGKIFADFKEKNHIYNASILQEIFALGDYNGFEIVDTFIKVDQTRPSVSYVINNLSKLDAETKFNILSKANRKRIAEYKQPAYNFVTMFSENPQLLEVANVSNNLQIDANSAAKEEDVLVSEENLPF